MSEHNDYLDMTATEVIEFIGDKKAVRIHYPDSRNPRQFDAIVGTVTYSRSDDITGEYEIETLVATRRIQIDTRKANGNKFDIPPEARIEVKGDDAGAYFIEGVERQGLALVTLTCSRAVAQGMGRYEAR